MRQWVGRPGWLKSCCVLYLMTNEIQKVNTSVRMLELFQLLIIMAFWLGTLRVQVLCELGAKRVCVSEGCLLDYVCCFWVCYLLGGLEGAEEGVAWREAAHCPAGFTEPLTLLLLIVFAGR